MWLELYFIVGWVFGLICLIYALKTNRDNDECTCMIITSLLYWPINLYVVMYNIVKGIVKYRQYKKNQ